MWKLKKNLSNFSSFDKETFQLASAHLEISPMIADMYLKLTKIFSDFIQNHLFRPFLINEIYWLSL